MSSVDDRIVNMQFNNKQFTQGAADSKKAMEDLERTLSTTAKSKGLSDFSSGVDQVTSKFGLMKVAGISAVATIASKATTAGLHLLKSLTIDPILDGFQEYQTNLNSIQTIMANTGAKVNVVNGYLAQLNHYSDQTIYNFSQMASAIGKFTAAGVSLPKATLAIKGMANAAALSGADANQLNSAMYQMSQALASGTIKLMDWNSLVNANMGGKNIQNALMATAKSMGPVGDAMDAAIAKQGTFRDSLTEGWLSAGVFTKTMKVMAGETDKVTGATKAFSAAQLVQMGYSKEQAKELHRVSQASIDAATKIKTFPQLMQVVKESVGSGFAKIFQDIFGNFNESVSLWTKVGTTITGVVGQIFGSIDTMLIGWRKLGGYRDLWAGIGNIFQTLGNIIRPFVTAFKSLLPATSTAGSGLAAFTHGFERVTNAMEVATRNFDVLTPILSAIFGAIKVGAQSVGALVRGLAPLAPILQNIGQAAGDMIAKGASIGSDLITGLLQGLDPGRIQAAVTGFANNIVEWVKGALGIASPSTEFIDIGLAITAGLVQGIIDGIPKVMGAIGDMISGVIRAIPDMFEGIDALGFASLLNAIFTGGLILSMKKISDSISGTFNSVSGVIDETGKSLKTWQNSLKSKMILEIAIAIGILAASVIALSLVDPKKLAIGIGAIASMMALLSGTLLALSKIKSNVQMAVLASSIVLISGAMVGLATAVTILGQQDPVKIATGIGAMAVILGLLVGAMLAFSKIKGSVEGMAASMFVIAAAMNVMAGAILVLGSLSMETLAKGLGAIAVGLALMVGAMLALDMIKGSVEGLAASIFVIASSLIVLATAVGIFGNMDMKTLAKGFGAVALGLGLMVGSLLILAPLAPEVLSVAGAMAVLAGAMVVMATAVGMFGSMDMSTLAKGFGAVALGLALLLAAALLAQFVAPGLIVLGAAILMLGAGMALAGIGMLAFATGLAVMVALGSAGIAVMTAAISAFIALLPSIAAQMAAAFVTFIQVIANSTEKIAAAFSKIFKSILGVITDAVPEIGKLFQALIDTAIKILSKSIPKFVELGFRIIDEFLKSAEKHIPSIIKTVGDLVVDFIKGFDQNLQKIITAGTDLLIHFLEGLGKAAWRITKAAGETILSVLNAIDAAVVKYIPQIREAGGRIIWHLINGMTDGLAGKVTDAISGALGGVNWSSFIPHFGGIMAEGARVAAEMTVEEIVAGAIMIANAIISEGNPLILAAQEKARAKETAAAKAATKAEIAADKAREAAKYARQHKKDQAAKKRAKELAKQAAEEKKAAEKAANELTKAQEHVDKVREFEQADLHGKGDIRSQDAQDLATKANRMLARAQVEAQEARKLMKTNREAGRKMLQQAKEDRAKAKKAAEDAKKANDEAAKYYEQEVKDRLAALQADEAAKKLDAEIAAADTAGKIALLTQRAEANEAKAKEMQAAVDAALADAEALAATDAAAAMKRLDDAEKAADEAQTAADAAKADRDTIEQLMTGGSGGSGGAGGTIQPSRSVLEDAASAVDRYTASLQQASELAAAQQSVVQFVQNNTSPKALTASEIYRQSRNLLSAAEVKMGAVA